VGNSNVTDTAESCKYNFEFSGKVYGKRPWSYILFNFDEVLCVKISKFLAIYGSRKVKLEELRLVAL